MKPSLLSLLVLFSFFTSLTTAKFLLDSQGEPIVNGASYYIHSPITPGPGGLDLAKTGNETCPHSVVQRPSSIFPDYGKVLSYVPVPSRWTIVEGEDGMKSMKVSGGYEKTLRGSFRIQPHTLFTYKIVFCPINGDSCRDLGIARGNDGNSLLVITGDYPLIAIFIKAKSSCT
ncbi:trypsin inhibitor DE-3-like [Prosopis cineraria]|uniref:trypsin inhibitor DE-3-like n=1 Tax=Prosopis cineraria TaxID=364024 RepID=UPI00240ECE11|nr:trypsin inhibitor DE-3-like [Prosopis cineraria]